LFLAAPTGGKENLVVVIFLRLNAFVAGDEREESCEGSYEYKLLHFQITILFAIAKGGAINAALLF
jgi:hypothetical protein